MTALRPDVVADLREENARLLAELRDARDRQAGSAEILRAIADASGDAERSLQQIAETTARLFDASSVTLNIASGDEWARMIRVGPSSQRVGSELSAAQLRIGGRNLPGTGFRENRQIHIPDLDNLDPAIADLPTLPHARAAGARAMAGTPLRREGKAIGALVVHRDRPVPFTDEELALLQSFADQAVIAIENARLFNETKEALERQTATADILKVIASSPSDVQPVFEAIATSAKRLIGGFSTAVFRFVDGLSHLAAFTPTTPAADEVLKATFPRPVADFAPFQMAQAGEVTQIADTEAFSDELLNISRARGYRSMLFAPLMNDGVSIGFIAVTRVQPGSFADHHVQLLRTFADQAVIAIENARLFEEGQAKTRDLTEALQQQTATADVLKVISRSAFDLQPVFDTIVQTASRLCDSEYAIIYGLKDDDKYHVVANNGADPVFLRYAIEHPLAPGRGSLVGRTALERKTVHMPDCLADPEYVALEFQSVGRYRSMIGVRLFRVGWPIGVILLLRTVVLPFTEKQIELVTTFAAQAVIAIENTRLFNETQEALERQTATADILQVISKSVADAQPVFDKITQSCQRLFNGSQVGINLVRP